MGDYTKVSLNDIEDAAINGGFSEVQEARFPRRDLGAEQTGLAHLRLKPGKREAFAHRHHKAEEVLVVLEGSGSLELDTDVVELASLDIVRVGPGTTRRLQAGADGLTVLVAGPHVEDDAEIVKDV
jgi:mannose-6-phosphate isomerase-like protein (cupin superfamily)